DRVAGAVALDLEPRSAQPAGEELVRGVLLRRVADPRRPDRVQLVEPLEQPLHAAILATSGVRPWTGRVWPRGGSATLATSGVRPWTCRVWPRGGRGSWGACRCR